VKSRPRISARWRRLAGHGAGAGSPRLSRHASQGREIPGVSDLEKFWFVLQQEMTESGKVSRFNGDISTRTAWRANRGDPRRHFSARLPKALTWCSTARGSPRCRTSRPVTAAWPRTSPRRNPVLPTP